MTMMKTTTIRMMTTTMIVLTIHSVSKAEELQGVAVKVLSIRTLTGWMSNMVVADYILGGDVTKLVSLNIWSGKASPVGATEEVAMAKVVVTAHQFLDIRQAQETQLLPYQ